MKKQPITYQDGTTKQSLRVKYAQERDKRIRTEGNDQYITLEGQLSYYKKDPYVENVPRKSIHDHVKFAYIGGGFAGLCTGAGLVQNGTNPNDIRIVEKGGDVGGTWYWNRYPGAMCDTAAIVYMPLLEETGHVISEKYCHGPEILEQSQKNSYQIQFVRQRFATYRSHCFKMGRKTQQMASYYKS